MAMKFDNWKTCLKREYWEYKRTLYLVPIVLSVLIFLGALAAEMYVSHIHEWALDQADIEDVRPDASEDDDLEFSIDMGDSPIEFVSMSLGLAWLVALYYLLSALYTDRRDGSILYWKSMPVSESTNVFTKLLFGTLAFTLVSLVAAWLMYLLLDLLGWGAMETNSEGEIIRIEQAFQPIKLLFWPFHGILAGLLWGAPVFAYCLLVSAFAKRARFLWLVVPLVIVSVLEGILFRSRGALEFLVSHMPHVALDTLQSSATLGDFWQRLFGPMLPSMVLGWVLATGFIVIAIWCRNNRFEV